MQGFTLTEALVTILIISTALLGLLKLQIHSLQYQQNATYQLVASNSAQEIIDRIQANTIGFNNGNYFLTGQENSNCLNAGCTPNDMAQHDTYEWHTQLSNQLPQASGIICRDSTPKDGIPGNPSCDSANTSDVPAVIKIWWQEHGSTSWKLLTQSFAGI